MYDYRDGDDYYDEEIDESETEYNNGLSSLELDHAAFVDECDLSSSLDLDDYTIEQIEKSPVDRSWRGCEIIDALQHPDYSTQKSFVKDNNGYREAKYGEKGSQRPDEILISDEGIDIREVKNWTSANALAKNINKQSSDRYEMFGDDLQDLTYVVSPKFTIEECDMLYNACKESDADLEFKYH